MKPPVLQCVGDVDPNFRPDITWPEFEPAVPGPRNGARIIYIFFFGRGESVKGEESFQLFC